MAKYIDLLITDNDLTLDMAGEPLLITDRDCITQDIKHLIRDSGLMASIIGQRDDVAVRAATQELMLLIEEDTRLVPGSVVIERVDTSTFFITATTYDFGDLTLEARI